MRNLSAWGRNHKWSARFLIILSYVLLNWLGIKTGILLNDTGFNFSPLALFAFIAVFLTGIFMYPFKSEKRNSISAAAFYVKQKTCDLLLAVSSFCMIVYMANHHNDLFTAAHAATSNLPVPKDSTLSTYKNVAAFTASMKDENGKTLKWKERKKLLKAQVKEIKKSKELSNGAKAGLIILSSIIALGLLALILGLACDLSCSGADGLAILVGVGGTALIVFLLVLTIRSITGKKRKRKQAIEKISVEPL